MILDDEPCCTTTTVQEPFEEHQKQFNVPSDLNPIKHQAPAGETSAIRGGPTSQFTGLKGSAGAELQLTR